MAKVKKVTGAVVTNVDTDKKTVTLKTIHENEAATKVICPIIHVAGERHALQFMWDKGDEPELKAVGFARLSETSNNWVSYTITTKGDKVTKIEIDEPNMRQIAEESAKVSFVTELADKD